MTPRELLKTDINNISDQQFRTVVTRLIGELEKSIEHSRKSTAADIRELRNSHSELINVINEMQNKLDAVQQGRQKPREE